jgi:hypothetical protein
MLNINNLANYKKINTATPVKSRDCGLIKG